MDSGTGVCHRPLHLCLGKPLEKWDAETFDSIHSVLDLSLNQRKGLIDWYQALVLLRKRPGVYTGHSARSDFLWRYLRPYPPPRYSSAPLSPLISIELGQSKPDGTITLHWGRTLPNGLG